MKGKQLKYVNKERDLGVLMTNDMKVSSQCTSASGKANQMLGMIKRTFTSRNPDILLSLYKTIVRPYLEYATASWSPYYTKDKQLIERVQHRFTRMLRGFSTLQYEERLNRLKLWTLEERRTRSDLIEVFKMYRNLSAVPLTTFFELDQEGRTRGHKAKLRMHYSRLDMRKHFFSERVVMRWNGLSVQAIEAESINSFKRELERLHRTQMGFFMD